MQNPKEVLREYLERLIHRYRNLKSLNRQIRGILDWQKPKRIDALNLGAYFFRLATYSLSRTILVELSMLLSNNEDRSIVDWLQKAREHAKSAEPSRDNSTINKHEREPVSEKEYRQIVDGHLAEIKAHDDLIRRIKARRDKAITHLDKAYFDDPKAVYKDYPLGDIEIDELFSTIDDILRTQYRLLFGPDTSMEVVSARNVDVVLQYARAFMRVRKDIDLIRSGFRPVDYMRDDYQKEKDDEEGE